MKIKRNLKITISLYDIFALLIILFPIGGIVGGIFSYYDELIGAVSFFYIWLLAFMGKIEKNCFKIMMAMTAVTFIGFLSNYVYRLLEEPFPIIIDALWLWKTFATFIAFAHVLRKDSVRQRVVKSLCVPAKFAIWLMFITSIVGQVVNIGVTGQDSILGLHVYGFFWNNGISTGWLGFCSLMILSVNYLSKKQFLGYTIITFFPLILTKSSMVYCFLLTMALLGFMYRRGGKFKVRYLIPIIILVAYVSWGDIQYYFLTDSSVRKELIIRGAEVANMYFPLGSGFATYGSDMAQRYYSKIYDMFGWRDSWAFGIDSTFLNDNFFASIIGQFGWIGFALYLYSLYVLFTMVNSKLVDKRIKITAVSTVLTIFVVMIGSASVKSIMGICTFAVLGIVFAEINSVTKAKKAEETEKSELTGEDG